MLQWMGGSRRKVTTSRRSTQKRQKQYFEQKKRQQQQSTGPEGYADDINVDGQHRKEHRSLDILSFLSLSTTPNECGSSLLSSRMEDQGENSRMKYHMQKSPCTIIPNAVTPAYFVEVKEANMSGSQHQFVNFGMQSANHQTEIVSPKNLFSAPHNHDSRANDKKIDNWNAAVEQELSVFDLVGDDGRDGHLARSPACEAHVAFSVDGIPGSFALMFLICLILRAYLVTSSLGKVGTETPFHSPKRLGRIPSDHPSLRWKNGRQYNSSDNFNHVFGDIELKLDEIMQDIDMLASNYASEFSTGLMDSRGNTMQNIYNVKDYMQCDGTTFRFMDDESLRSPSSDEFVYERENDITWTKWSGQIDYCSESPHLLKRKLSSKTTKFHILESPPEHRTSETGHEFKHSFGDLLLRCNFDFGDIDGQVDWAGCVTEDAKDNLSFPSEESCSSSAVMGDTTYITPNLRHGSTRRSSNICGSIRNEYCTDDRRYGSNRISSNTYVNIGNECSMDDIIEVESK